MKRRVLDIIRCPIYSGKLDLLVFESKKIELSSEYIKRIEDIGLNKNEFDEEILAGALINKEKMIYYPIINGVPRMLTYNCGIFNQFTAKYKKQIAEKLSNYSLPNNTPPVGEETVIRSFSNEWVNYDWNEETYWKTDSKLMYKSFRIMLDLDNKPVLNKTVLEVGIGIGGIANYMAEQEGCELFGIDLGYAVDAAYKNFNNNPFFHIIQASAFNMPFENSSFDYIYSQGVLHHSSDPKICFNNVAKLCKTNGFFYVWLYSTVSENRNLFRKFLMLAEKTFRPLVWRLPSFLQSIILFPVAILYIIHQNFLQNPKDNRLIKYTYREALHAARDRFTPRYAFRYSEEEIVNWYKEAGFINLLPSSKRKYPDFLIPDFYIATVVIGQKS
ncbi:MAG TPA: methyltransferase domain-containing protein [Melioribacteraceae bacterium]|nr:methyltransferase domain-containing protein [Melioribacteraceae bacterium]